MAELDTYSVLLASSGQLSGDGQLRESFKERRDRKGKDFPLWYLSCNACKRLIFDGSGCEAVVAKDPKIITWLQLRFGGVAKTAELSTEQLNHHAIVLPPSPPLTDFEIDKSQNCSKENCLGTCQQ